MVVKPHFHDLNHTYEVCHFIELCSSSNYLCSLFCRDYPSWQGQPNCVTVDNQRIRGGKVAGF
jgi:hypothetical protein